MTAGQRNCYIAIGECLERYRLDDVLYALREHVGRIGLAAEDKDHAAYRRAALLLDKARERLAKVEVAT